jgi:hypothetical protein
MEKDVSDPTSDDITRATARLPGLDIEIVHRRPRDADAEQISIHLQAVPSFEAFSSFLEAANPFAFWVKAAQLMWMPWLNATRSLMPQGRAGIMWPKPPEA